MPEKSHLIIIIINTQGQIVQIHLGWPNTVFARAFADVIQHLHEDFKTTNMPSLLLQRYVGKGNDAKNPALNATHAQLLEKLRPIALAETFRFLTIQSLEFQEIWQKNRPETTLIIYRKNLKFDIGNF